MRAQLKATGIGLLATLTLTLAPAAFAQSVKHVSHDEAMSAAVSKPAPEYSSIARQLRVEGNVHVSVSIDEEGRVEKVDAVSGNPVLVHCTEEALKKWKFTPFKEDGKPTKAVAAMNFAFKL